MAYRSKSVFGDFYSGFHNRGAGRELAALARPAFVERIEGAGPADGVERFGKHCVEGSGAGARHLLADRLG